MDQKNQEEDKKERIFKIIVMILIIIIIILLLLMGCSCTSKLIGKIGDIFSNEGNYTIDGNTDNEIIVNQDLKFYLDEFTMYLSDKDGKLSYYYQNIHPGEFTCHTSDSEIATCYVKDNYVIVFPKKTGDVEIYLDTFVNGKTYRAKSLVHVLDSNRSIILSSNSGSVLKGNTKNITITLLGLSGNINVSVEDSSIASAKIVNGVLKVYGKNVGTTKVTVSVTYQEKVYTATYEIHVINPSSKNSDSLLKNLTTSNGTLHFSSHSTHYAFEVHVDKLTLTPTLSNSKSNMSYTFNGKPVDSLKDLPLEYGENKVVITVTSEDGSRTTYEITIYRTDDEVGSLKDIEVSDGVLTPDFQSDILDYSVSVEHQVDHFSLDAFSSNSSAQMTYSYKGKNVSDLHNLPLEYGDNEIEVFVTENGVTKKYTITVHRKKRTVEFEKNEYTFYVDGQSKNAIPFEMMDDGIDIPLEKYDLKKEDIVIEGYSGSYDIEDGVLVLKPDVSMIGKSAKLKITYGDQTVETTLHFATSTYYLFPSSYDYQVTLLSSSKIESLILNSNLVTGDVHFEFLNDGVIRIYGQDKNNYIDIFPNNDLAKSLSSSQYKIHQDDSSSITIDTSFTTPGDYQYRVSGFSYGGQVSSFFVTFHVEQTYLIQLDSNGGFFDEFNSEGFLTNYTFEMKQNETFDLSTYVAYKEADKENCLYYTMIGYGTNPNGPILYSSSSSFVVTSSIKLYVIYDETKKESVELQEKRKLYLTDVDLFYNEEYFKAYGESKIIYPGATGKYLMNFKNESDKEVTIIGMTLEEDTLCVEQGCLNMGYTLKNTSSYYYGNNNQYPILYKDSSTLLNGTHTLLEIPFEEHVTLAPNEEVRFDLGWQWIYSIDKQNDELDTIIGNLAGDLLNQKYSLTVSLDFYTKSNQCEIEGELP